MTSQAIEGTFCHSWDLFHTVPPLLIVIHGNKHSPTSSSISFEKNKKKAGNFQPFLHLILQNLNLNHHCRHLQQEIYPILSAYLSILYEYFPTRLEHLLIFRSELHGLL